MSDSFYSDLRQQMKATRKRAPAIRYTDDLMQDVRRLHGQGLSNDQIVAALGLPPRASERFRRKLGMTANRGKSNAVLINGSEVPKFKSVRNYKLEIRRGSGEC